MYPHWLANILHSAPLAALLLLGVASTLSTPPRAAGQPAAAGRPTLTTLGVEALVALASLLCAMALPAAVGAVRAYRTREWGAVYWGWGDWAAPSRRLAELGRSTPAACHTALQLPGAVCMLFLAIIPCSFRPSCYAVLCRDALRVVRQARGGLCYLCPCCCGWPHASLCVRALPE